MKWVRTIVCIVIILMGGSRLLEAQKKELPSKYSRSKVALSAKNLLDQATAISKKDPKAALDLVAEALFVSIQEKDQLNEALSYKVSGSINLEQRLFPAAQENLIKSLKLFTDLKNGNQQYEVRKLLAEAYEGNRELDKSLKEWESLLKTATNNQNEEEIATAKSAIARIFEKQGKEDLAVKKYKDLEKMEEKRGNEKGVISANNKIGDIYLKQEKTQEALSHFSKSQSLALESDDIEELTVSNSMIGKVLRKEKRYEDELILREKSIEINKRNNNREGLNNEYLEVARIHLEQDNSSMAIPYLKQSLILSDQLGLLEKKVAAMRNLSEAYSKLGKTSEALASYQSLIVVMDTLQKRNERQLTRMLDFNNELSERQKKIEALEKDQELNAKTIELLKKDQNLKEESMKKQAILIYSLIGGLLIVFVASYLLYKSAHTRRIANQLLALKSLRSQMNPHFIFNALNSVNNFISQNDERSANKYLSDFSRLMRAVMENSQHDFVPFQSEIKILELYLSLEHFRFKEKFDYAFDVNPEIDQDSISIPPMLIQPYIENAVWHGLRYKEDKGFLKVRIYQEEDAIKVLIEDNGIGRKRSQELKTANQKETVSTGLRNIESRLKIINEIHRKNLSVVISDLVKENQSGTRVLITIPVEVNEMVN